MFLSYVEKHSANNITWYKTSNQRRWYDNGETRRYGEHPTAIMPAYGQNSLEKNQRPRLALLLG